LESKTLDPSELLWRRVPFTDPKYVKPDGSISSLAFMPRKTDDGLSVDRKKLAQASTSILDEKRYRLYEIDVAFVHSLGELQCVSDPLPDNPAHALIKGKMSKGKARQLSRHAKRFPYPD